MKIQFLCIFLLLSATTTAQVWNLPVSDSFETDTLSKIWNTDKFVAGALSIQSEYQYDGKKSALLILKSGDQIAKEKGSIFERAELKETKKLYSIEEKSYEYGFSLFLPSDFPKVDTRLVIAQWKQNCEKDNCTPDNPVLALRYNSGVFYITKQSNIKRDTLFVFKGSPLNQWLDFKFQTKFSSNDSGKIIAYLNEKKIIDFEGKTAYPENNGEYIFPNKFYFKIGLYRDLSKKTMKIFIDKYYKKELEKL